jgi:hypothetical protein
MNQKKLLELYNEEFPDYKTPKNIDEIYFPKIVTEKDLLRLEKIRNTPLP